MALLAVLVLMLLGGQKRGPHSPYGSIVEAGYDQGVLDVFQQGFGRSEEDQVRDEVRLETAKAELEEARARRRQVQNQARRNELKANAELAAKLDQYEAGRLEAQQNLTEAINQSSLSEIKHLENYVDTVTGAADRTVTGVIDAVKDWRSSRSSGPKSPYTVGTRNYRRWRKGSFSTHPRGV